jgi:hypothetical protein
MAICSEALVKWAFENIVILCLKEFYLRITSRGRGHEREMHRKLCMHAQFSVLMVRLYPIKTINSSSGAKLRDGDQNKFDIIFEYIYKTDLNPVFIQDQASSIQDQSDSAATDALKLGW